MLMHWLRKYQNTILIGVVAAFLISMFVGFGLYMRSGPTRADSVVEVNDEKVPYRQYTAFYNRVVSARRDKGEDLSPETLQQVKQEILQSLIQEAVFHQEAEKYGLEVTDGELAQSLSGIPAFQKDGKFDIQAYAQALQYVLRTTPEDFEEAQRRQIAISRLRSLVMQSVKIGDKELDFEYRTQPAAAKKTQDPVKEREQFRQKLLQEKGAHVLNRWYQQLGTNVKVKVHLDEIEKNAGAAN